MLQPADRFGGTGVPGSGISLLHLLFYLTLMFHVKHQC